MSSWEYEVFILLNFYVSVNSKPDHPPPPGDPRGFAYSSCPWGRVFAPLSCPGVSSGGGVLNQSRSSIILKKKTAIFALSLKQMALFMFIYARREQCDLGPIYTITSTKCIRSYPGKLTFILVNISPYPGRLHAKKTKLYSRFLLLRILYPDSPVHTSRNKRRVFRFFQLCCKFTRVNAFTP